MSSTITAAAPGTMFDLTGGEQIGIGLAPSGSRNHTKIMVDDPSSKKDPDDTLRITTMGSIANEFDNVGDTEAIDGIAKESSSGAQ